MSAEDYAPMGCYDKQFVMDLLILYSEGFSMEELSVYFEMDQAELDYIIEMYLPLALRTGDIVYKQKEE